MGSRQPNQDREDDKGRKNNFNQVFCFQLPYLVFSFSLLDLKRDHNPNSCDPLVH